MASCSGSSPLPRLLAWAVGTGLCIFILPAMIIGLAGPRGGRRGLPAAPPDRSQDSTAVVLSDSNSTEDLFTELASSQDSAKKPFPERRPCASCSEATTTGKEVLGPAEERGKSEEPLENSESCHAAEPKLDPQAPVGIASKASLPSLSQWDPKRRSEPCTDPFPQSLPADLEEQRHFLTEHCVTSFHLCLSRFPQHYKSLYRLAYLYTYSTTHKNLQWARDVLLGSSIPWQQLKHMPAQGLFCERNKTNFFNGIWRIPVDEIDRPGSFASHMNRSIVLLLNVLLQLKDYNTLLKVSSMLQRTPDQGKKYLRDADRQVLAQRAFILTVLVLEDMLNELTEVSEDQDSKCCSLLGARMTTDVSNKASAEEGQEALPKRTALSDRAGAAYGGAENAVKEVAHGQPPGVMDTVLEPLEAVPSQEATEGPRPGSAEPMDVDEYSNDPGKLASAQGLPGRISKDKLPESRTAELSLEDLSISSKHQQLDTVKVRVQAAPTEEVSQRPNRKRKLINDAESGKTLLLDAYRVWQQGQKVMTYDLGKIEKIMSETYMLIKQVDEDAALEQAVKFCQVHIGASTQKQSTGETPTTPKHPKDSKESFFSAAPAALAPSAGTADAMASDSVLRLTDLHAKSKTASPPPPSSSSVLLLPPQEQTGVEPIEEEVPSVSRLVREAEEEEEEEEEGKLARPLEGLALQQQEPHLCQQVKTAAVAPSASPACWQVELESGTSTSTVGHSCGRGEEGPAPTAEGGSCYNAEEPPPPPHRAAAQDVSQRRSLLPAPGCKKELQAASQSVGSQASKADSSRMRSRVLPNMPKLFIPSSITKFPPEITVTPPTPTLLSPKGSISEETKQKLKSAILSAQSAANVKKESLCQPALEIVETSSQESSLEESDTDEEEEEEDYMDV